MLSACLHASCFCLLAGKQIFSAFLCWILTRIPTKPSSHLSTYVSVVGQRLIESLGLVSLQVHTAHSETKGMAGVYVALAQALLCEHLDANGGSGLGAWRLLYQSVQEKTEGRSGNASLPGEPVLEAFGQAVRRHVVGRARQLGAAQNCELPVLSCAADAFNVQIHLLKIAGDTLEEAVLYVLLSSMCLPSLATQWCCQLSADFQLFSSYPATEEEDVGNKEDADDGQQVAGESAEMHRNPSSSSSVESAADHDGVNREAGATRQLYVCSTGARVWALRRRGMEHEAHDADLLQAAGVLQGLGSASLSASSCSTDAGWRRSELVARVVNKVEERVKAGVCETENWLADAVAAVGLELDV